MNVITFSHRLFKNLCCTKIFCLSNLKHSCHFKSFLIILNFSKLRNQTAGQHFTKYIKHLLLNNKIELLLSISRLNFFFKVEFYINVVNYIFKFKMEYIFNFTKLGTGRNMFFFFFILH